MCFSSSSSSTKADPAPAPAAPTLPTVEEQVNNTNPATTTQQSADVTQNGTRVDRSGAGNLTGGSGLWM